MNEYTIALDIGGLFINVPENGWIYAEPFRDSIVDDYISKRGIARLAAELGADASLDVRELAECARNGDAAAALVFERFGGMLGEALNPFIGSFAPGAIIIGEQIANSHDLFEHGLRRTLRFTGGEVKFASSISHSTFVGVSKLLSTLRTERHA